jgi:hypothetical protein
MCLVPNLVAHPRDDGPPPLRRVCPTNTALDAAAGRTTVAPPSISNTTPHFAWGGAGPGKQNERISPESLLVDGPPIHWPWAALARKDREGDQAGERDRRRVRAPLMARGRRRPTVGGGVTTRVKYQILPMVRAGQRSRRGAAERSSGAAEQTLELRAPLSLTSAAAEQTSQ